MSHLTQSQIDQLDPDSYLVVIEDRVHDGDTFTEREVHRLLLMIQGYHHLLDQKNIDAIVADNERMRDAFQKMVEQFKASGHVAFNFSGCEWCGAVWPKSETQSFDETLKLAAGHVEVCKKNPVKNDRDELRAKLAETIDELRAYRFPEQASTP